MALKTRTWKVVCVVLAIGLIATAVMMMTIAEVHEHVAGARLVRIDDRIQEEVHDDTPSSLNRLMFDLSTIGKPEVMMPVVPLLAAALWWRGLRRQAIVLVISTGGAGVLAFLLKLHFRRVRPDVPWAFAHEPSFSFPSGHSVLAVVLYGTLLYLALGHLRRDRDRVGAILCAAALIFGIGYSRIYLGVHYPSDVAAGYFVGTVWLMAVMLADRFVQWDVGGQSKRRK